MKKTVSNPNKQKNSSSPAKGKQGSARNKALVKEQAQAVPKDRGPSMTKKGTTNAFRLTPALGENVKSEMKKDISRVKKAATSGQKSGLNAGARDVQKLAGLRAASRIAGRANLVVGAATTGVAIGKAINKSVETKKRVEANKTKINKTMSKSGYESYTQAIKNNKKGIGGAFK